MKNRSLFLREQKNNLIAHVQMTKNRMFMLNIKYANTKYLNISVKDCSWLWHLRFGHLHFGGLKQLSSKKMVKGLPHIDFPKQFCEGCVLSKQSRKSFPKEASYHAKKPLELIHIYICGPIIPTSLGKHQYFLTFIDDYTRKIWIYILKEKAKIFNMFKKFKAIIKNKSGYSIKVIYSDQDGEFTSNSFEAFCKENGIWHQLIAPYSPQQNDVAERKNYSILNMV